MLGKEVIGKVLQLADLYRQRLVSHSFKWHLSIYEKHARQKIKNLLSREGQDDLLELLDKVELTDLRQELFNSTLLDLDVNSELRIKTKQFKQYLSKNMPSNSYHLNDLEKKYKSQNLQQLKDEEILEKFTKIEMEKEKDAMFPSHDTSGVKFYSYYQFSSSSDTVMFSSSSSSFGGSRSTLGLPRSPKSS